MESQVPNEFVRKIAALPMYEPKQVSPRDFGPDTPLKERGKETAPANLTDSNLHALETPAEVITAPSAAVYGLGTMFQHDELRNDLDAVRTARAALSEYRSYYAERQGQFQQWARPFRYIMARHTGLPAFLSGYLDAPLNFQIKPDDGLREVAVQWLAQSIVSRALFGVELDATAMQARLRILETAYVPWPDMGYPKELDPWRAQRCAHVRFIQVVPDAQVDGAAFPELPVVGAEVVVHLRNQEPRMSASSSFFPIVPRPAFKLFDQMDAALERAKIIAHKAMLGEVQDAAAIGIYLALLAPLLQAAENEAMPRWTAWHTKIAQRLAAVLVESGDERFWAFRDLLEQADPSILLRTFAYFKNALEEFAWQVRIVPYAASPAAILPFAGTYYLACNVELELPEQEVWQVWVDLETGSVLGEPERSSLRAPAQYYATPASATANNKSSMDDATLEQRASFVEFRRADTNGVVRLTAMHALSAQQQLEAANIAFHASELFARFTNQNEMGIVLNPETNPPQLLDTNRVLTSGAKLIAKIGDTTATFNTKFNPNTGTILFQTGSPTTTDNRFDPAVTRTVENPSLDPEIIMHEFAHAFMCKLKADPAFGRQERQWPFAMPLLEGYATFFARAVAQRNDFDTNSVDGLRWARYAYRGTWNDTWDIARTTRTDGADVLPSVNLYPKQFYDGMQAYDVAMVWARALWDVAWRLSAHPADPSDTTVGLRDQYDQSTHAERVNAFVLACKLALNAYYYLHGWTSNFELAAEGVLDGIISLSTTVQDNLRKAFKWRGIYAEQGIQCVALTASDIYFGADQGVMRWTGRATDRIESLGLSEVVALQVAGNVLYAATETGVFQRNLTAGSAWQELGGWHVDQIPLSLLVITSLVNGAPVTEVIVGTSGSANSRRSHEALWTFRNNIWQPHLAAGNFSGMATSMTYDATNQKILVSTMSNQVYSVNYFPDTVNLMTTTALTNLNAAVRFTSTVMENGTLIVGAVDGIREAGVHNAGNFPSGTAVLCLGMDTVTPAGRRLLAGTVSGLMVRAAGANWQIVSGANAPDDAIVMCIASSSTRVVVGTLDQGLYVYDGANWSKPPV